MKKVFIVGQSFFHYFKEMYESRGGYELVDSIEDADIVQFTGGADIAPEFYHQHMHDSTHTAHYRDREELEAFKQASAQGKFLAGVCRGGQLLNALSGGSMYQDVTGHGVSRGHGMKDLQTGSVINVTSLHHQMMIAGPDADILAVSDEVRSPSKIKMTSVTKEPCPILVDDDDVEVEALWYPHTKSFCYQPHPEFADKNSDCRNWYFDTMERLYDSLGGAEVKA